MPNVPTVAEAGVKGYLVTSWNGIFAPKGTPQDVIDTVNKAMHEVLAMPDVKEHFAKIGVEAHASTPDELMTRLKDDITKWDAVIAKAGHPEEMRRSFTARHRANRCRRSSAAACGRRAPGRAVRR